MTPHAPPARPGLLLVPAALLGLLLGPAQAPAEPPRVKHPNLLLNADEIEQVKQKIKDHDWAARLFERVRALADEPGRTTRLPREAALVYALTGEKRYARDVRQALVGHARSELPKYDKLDVEANPDFGAWGPLQTIAWSYDLTHDAFTDDERELVERYLRTAARSIIAGAKVRANSQDLVFGKHFEVGVVGYCLGDRELIDWALNDPGAQGPAFGGFYQVLDANVRDRFFWSEAPRYALGRTLQGMLALAEAARHYDGTDLCHYTSKKSGGSIRGLLDGYLRLAYPPEKTGVGTGSLRMASYGDASTAYTPRGELTDTWLLNPVPGGPKLELTLNGELELAWARYHDPGYAWLLGLNPKRDGYIDTALSGGGGSGKVWGYVALTHGEPLPEKTEPPSAPSGVYPGQGIAVLRSDESPRYWSAGGTMAVLRLGSAIGHGHRDYFHLLLHGKGRLLYPDLQLVTYEPTYLSWTREGIAHNTLLVDHQSPRPCPCTTREEFTPEAKFCAVTGSPFEDVTQTRALLLTPDYLADVFRAADGRGRPRDFDWVVHGLGRLYPGSPAAYRPTDALLPSYWWVDDERGRTTGATWQADWVQHSGGVQPGLQPFGKEWFAQTAGVRLTMLGSPGTEVYAGAGPMTDGPPYARLDGNPEGSVPLVLARRRSAATTFAAVHEPYDTRPQVRQVRRVEETDEAVGLAVEGEAFSDRVLVGFRPDQEQTLRSADEAITFTGYGYVRTAGGRVTARGRVTAFRLRAPGVEKAAVTLNGEEQPARRDGDFLVFGRPAAPAGGADPADDPRERAAAVHYSFLPEEAHLSAGGDKEVTLHLRCVGRGEAKGRLRLTPPPGISVEPAAVDLAGLREGDERVVRLRVRAAGDAANRLDAVRVEPADGAEAAEGALPVSVGVVITEDRRIPLVAQSVVRAPGYTMKVDHQSGVCCCLLDADGHRRHGHVSDGPNSYLGIGALQRGGDWVLRYRTPCRFVFEGPDSLVVVSGSGGEQVRLRYTFHEDRVVLALVPPTSAAAEFTLWLGEFDALGAPQHNGTAPAKGGKDAAVTADWMFFPHPVHRQGLLVIPPPKSALRPGASALNVRLRAGQEVVLRFATAEEVPGLVKE
jgi:hypothetical protein